MNSKPQLAIVSSKETLYILTFPALGGYLCLTAGTLGPMTVFTPTQATYCTKDAAEEFLQFLNDKDYSMQPLEEAIKEHQAFIASRQNTTTS